MVRTGFLPILSDKRPAGTDKEASKMLKKIYKSISKPIASFSACADRPGLPISLNTSPALRMKNIKLKFARLNIVATKINLFNCGDKFLKENFLWLISLSVSERGSLTKNKGVRAVNAMMAAIKNMERNDISKFTKRIYTTIEPIMAPALSMALWTPKPYPLFSAVPPFDSETMASRGASRRPLPILSIGRKIKICNQVDAKGKKNLDMAEKP